MPGPPDSSPATILECLRAFYAGATHPSLGAVMLLIGFNLTWMICAVLFITPDAMTGALPRYLAKGPKDLNAFVTGIAMRMSVHPKELPLVAVIGSSAAREAFDADDIQEELLVAGLPRIPVYNCGTGRQSICDSITIADQLPMDASGVVIFGIGPSPLSDNPGLLDVAVRTPRFGLRSERLESLAIADGIETSKPSGIYALDQVGFLAPRLAGAGYHLLTGTPHTMPKHRSLNRPPRSEEAARAHCLHVVGRLSQFEANKEWNLGLIRELIAVVKARPGLTLVLIEHPMNPDFIRDFLPTGLLEQFRTHLTELASEQGVPILPLEIPGGPTPEMFYDWCHLSDREAIRGTSQALARRLAELLKNDSPKGTRR